MNQPVTFDRFVDQFKHREIPQGHLEKCTASKIAAIKKSGKERWRLCLKDLPSDCFKVICYLEEQAPLFISNYIRSRIKTSFSAKNIYIHIKSATTRFYLPESILHIEPWMNQQKLLLNLHSIIRLVQTRQLFLEPRAANTKDHGWVKSKDPSFSLVPVEAMVKIAKEGTVSHRLSKSCLSLQASIDVFPDGFIAKNLNENAIKKEYKESIKIYATPDGTRVARKAHTFSEHHLKDLRSMLRSIKYHSKFNHTDGIIPTLSIGFYENKQGQIVLVFYHPLYEGSFLTPSNIHATDQERLQAARNLLHGLAALHAKGSHNRFTSCHILFKHNPFEVAISHLDSFSHYKGNQAGEVRNLGWILFDLLPSGKKKCPLARWNSNIQEEIDHAQFTPAAAQLLMKMLRRRPCSAKEALDCFDQNFPFIDPTRGIYPIAEEPNTTDERDEIACC